MNLFEALFISIGLAMDAFTVAICKGLSMKKINWKKVIIIGLWFGFFQAFMPAIGFLLGSTFGHLITSIDHWIAFILLGFIGINMIKESLNKKSCEEENTLVDDTTPKTMFPLAIATSIDAFAIGIAYACVYGSNNAINTFTLIGIITFVLSIIGTKIGNKFGAKYESKAEFIGGFILVMLGCKILLEHLNIMPF